MEHDLRTIDVMHQKVFTIPPNVSLDNDYKKAAFDKDEQTVVDELNHLQNIYKQVRKIVCQTLCDYNTNVCCSFVDCRMH